MIDNSFFLRSDVFPTLDEGDIRRAYRDFENAGVSVSVGGIHKPGRSGHCPRSGTIRNLIFTKKKNDPSALRCKSKLIFLDAANDRMYLVDNR